MEETNVRLALHRRAQRQGWDDEGRATNQVQADRSLASHREAETFALAGSATQSPEWLSRQKVCKKDASAQVLHLSKKRACVKECMA